MIPPGWKQWPEKVVITGNDEQESLWAGQFKGLSLIHYDLLQLLKSKILGSPSLMTDDTHCKLHTRCYYSYQTVRQVIYNRLHVVVSMMADRGD